MKRFTISAVLAVAVLATGCTLFGGPVAEAPTQTPYPTYTPFPTYTPPPTATATFLPSPTFTPAETATPTVDPAATFLPTATSSGGIQAVLLYDTHLRRGPGTAFPSITMLSAGEPITILGRDLNGGWVYIRTTSGLEGWVRITQVQGPLDIPRIPLAPQIPTPGVTITATATATPTGQDDTTETPDATATDTETPTLTSTATATPTPSPSSGPISFELTAGAAEKCQQVIWEMPQRYAVRDTDAPIYPFDADNPQNVVGRAAFRFFRTAVPEFIQLRIRGNIMPGACNEDNLTCRYAVFQMCAAAPANSPTGGSDYRQNVTLQIGTQSYGDFYLTVEAFIPTSFIVKAP